MDEAKAAEEEAEEEPARVPRADDPLLDKDSPFPRAYWQALGRLVCEAANAEHILRNAYYAVRQDAEGPASGEGVTCDRLIDLCIAEVIQRNDFDEARRDRFVGALERLRDVNRERNRLFHDSWMFTVDGGAVQVQSVRRGTPVSRKITITDVEKACDRMASAGTEVLVTEIKLTGGGLTSYSVSDAGEPTVQRSNNMSGLESEEEATAC